MNTAIGPWWMRSSSAHCDPELGKGIGENLGKKHRRDTWRKGLARHLAKRIGEELGEEGWKGAEGGGGRGEGILRKSRNPHLGGGV